MSASAVPAFKMALVDALVASPALAAVQVLWDMGEDTEPADSSAIGVLEDGFQQNLIGAAGSRDATRDEQITVTLGVRHHAYTTARASEQEMWRIVEAVQDVIAADRDLGGRVHNTALTTGRHTGFQPAAGAWEQRIELSVTARARLRPT